MRSTAMSPRALFAPQALLLVAFATPVLAQGFDAPLGDDAPAPLATGAKGPEVRRLQERLNLERRKLDQKPLREDGKFGPDLALALADFQKARGLPVTGGADPATLAALAPKPNPIDVSKGELTGDAPFKRSVEGPRDVRVRRLPAVEVEPGKSTRPIAFTSGLTVDADGKDGKSLDKANGKNITALFHAPNKKGEKPRYLDARKDKFVVLPKWLADKYGAAPGDLAAVMKDGQVVPAVFGDTGPSQQLGEGSIAVAKELGLSGSPHSGGTDDADVTYVVFPGTGRGAGSPLSADEIARRVPELVAATQAAIEKPTKSVGLAGAVGK